MDLSFLRPKFTNCRWFILQPEHAASEGLNAPEKSLDAVWANEAETRLAAYKAGQVKAIPLSEVLAKYRVS